MISDPATVFFWLIKSKNFPPNEIYPDQPPRPPTTLLLGHIPRLGHRLENLIPEADGRTDRMETP